MVHLAVWPLGGKGKELEIGLLALDHRQALHVIDRALVPGYSLIAEWRRPEMKWSRMIWPIGALSIFPIAAGYAARVNNSRRLLWNLRRLSSAPCWAREKSALAWSLSTGVIKRSW